MHVKYDDGDRETMTWDEAAALRFQAVEAGESGASVELVDDVEGAIEHIHSFGSAHTDVILTEDQATATAFLQGVDSACVFHNGA